MFREFDLCCLCDVCLSEAEHEQQLIQLKSLVQQLPPVNRETLRRIIGHLNKWVTTACS